MGDKLLGTDSVSFTVSKWVEFDDLIIITCQKQCEITFPTSQFVYKPLIEWPNAFLNKGERYLSLQQWPVCKISIVIVVA